MARRRSVMMLIVLLLALGSLLSGSPAGADVPPCWDTRDVGGEFLFTYGCVEIFGTIGYVGSCSEAGECGYQRICIIEESLAPCIV